MNMRMLIILALALNLPGSARAGSLAVLVLGSGSPRPFGRAGTSYIVEVNGKARILVDAGPGMFLPVGELNINLEPVDTMLLTHLHIDHSGDLPGSFKARSLTARASSIRFNVFGPAGGGVFPSTTRLLNLLFEKGGPGNTRKRSERTKR
jgi:ribonuclease BN (tRNA processing enzyme)